MPQSQLAVRADVGQKCTVRLFTYLTCHQSTGDIRPHKGRHATGQVDPCGRRGGQRKLLRISPAAKQFVRNKGRMGQAVHIPVCKQVQHGGISCQNDRIHILRGNCRFLFHLMQQFVKPAANALGESLPFARQRLLDPGDHIRAIDPLGIGRRRTRQQRPVMRIQPGRQRSGADIHDRTVLLKNRV